MPYKKFRVDDKSDVGKRLDIFLSRCVPELSRSQIQNLIQKNKVLLNTKAAQKPSYNLKYKDRVEIEYSFPVSLKIHPEKIPLDIVYQDECIGVINKPSGMVVHPGARVKKHTLVNALLYHFPHIENVGPKTRPGIVHRLDKETSGLVVLAKNLKAFQNLKEQFKKRVVEKRYLALVWGRYLKKKGVISWPIGRHVKDGARMSVKTKKPKNAETYFEVIKVFEEHSFLDIKPVTGRTHQIRVHMSASGHPIVGDRHYGRKKTPTQIQSRLFLHAYYLSFIHPEKKERQEFTVPLPEELEEVLRKLT